MKNDRESEHQAAANELDRLEKELASIKDSNNKLQLEIDEKESEIQNRDSRIAAEKKAEEDEIENLEQIIRANKTEAGDLNDKIGEEDAKVREFEAKNRE